MPSFAKTVDNLLDRRAPHTYASTEPPAATLDLDDETPRNKYLNAGGPPPPHALSTGTRDHSVFRLIYHPPPSRLPHCPPAVSPSDLGAPRRPPTGAAAPFGGGWRASRAAREQRGRGGGREPLSGEQQAAWRLAVGGGWGAAEWWRRRETLHHSQAGMRKKKKRAQRKKRSRGGTLRRWGGQPNRRTNARGWCKEGGGVATAPVPPPRGAARGSRRQAFPRRNVGRKRFRPFRGRGGGGGEGGRGPGVGPGGEPCMTWTLLPPVWRGCGGRAPPVWRDGRCATVGDVGSNGLSRPPFPRTRPPPRTVAGRLPRRGTRCAAAAVPADTNGCCRTQPPNVDSPPRA